MARLTLLVPNNRSSMYRIPLIFEFVLTGIPREQ